MICHGVSSPGPGAAQDPFETSGQGLFFLFCKTLGLSFCVPRGHSSCADCRNLGDGLCQTQQGSEDMAAPVATLSGTMDQTVRPGLRASISEASAGQSRSTPLGPATLRARL